MQGTTSSRRSDAWRRTAARWRRISRDRIAPRLHGPPDLTRGLYPSAGTPASTLPTSCLPDPLACVGRRPPQGSFCNPRAVTRNATRACAGVQHDRAPQADPLCSTGLKALALSKHDDPKHFLLFGAPPPPTPSPLPPP